MRFFLSAVLLLTLSLVSVSPAHAGTARAQKYLSQRNVYKISQLSLAAARKGGGHHGKVVEWAGNVQGMAATSDGMFMFLRLRDGQTIPIRVSATGTLQLGTAVYVLGRVVEKSGLIQYLDPIALAPCKEVAAAYIQTQQRYDVAQQRIDEQRAEAARYAASERERLASSPAFTTDSRTLASRAGNLSLQSAVSWITSFNKGMDTESANAIARTVLYYSGTYGVDARLALSLLAAESAFRPDAVSSAGAQGLGQLMPGTADMLGVRNAFNPLENAEASVRHLGQLLSRWRSSPQQYQLALASYNAGAGAVEQYNGIPPYNETINYVQTIMGYYSELSEYH